MRRSARAFFRGLLLFVIVALVALAAGAWWLSRASLPEQHAWETRLSLVSLKLQGRIPHVGWSAMLPRLGSAWLKEGPPPLARIVARGPAPCPARWETAMGHFWGTERDGRDLDWIVMEQIGWRIYDRGSARIRPGDVVFDVGAHLGTFTRFALDRGAAKVVMFEPQPVNARCLERTFASDMQQGRVVLVEAAVWHTSGRLSFSDKGPGTMGHVDPEGNDADDLSVPAITFDDAVERLQLQRVDFIKMDIEGAERHALTGGRRTLARSRPRMAICIYHAPDDHEVIPRIVAEANPAYEMFTRGGFQAYFH
jgi:FkbM family methyltransferase